MTRPVLSESGKYQVQFKECGYEGLGWIHAAYCETRAEAEEYMKERVEYSGWNKRYRMLGPDVPPEPVLVPLEDPKKQEPHRYVVEIRFSDKSYFPWKTPGSAPRGFRMKSNAQECARHWKGYGYLVRIIDTKATKEAQK